MLQLEYTNPSSSSQREYHHQETWTVGQPFPTLGREFDFSNHVLLQVDGEEMDLIDRLWPGGRPYWDAPNIENARATAMIFHGERAKFVVTNLKLYINWLTGLTQPTK